MYRSKTPTAKRRVVYDLLQRVRRHHSPSQASFAWDLTDLLLRIEELRATGVAVNLAAVLTRATALTQRRFPQMNTRVFWTWRGPREVTFDEVSCNLVVHRRDGDEDLLFPVVIRNADQLSVLEIAELIRSYKKRPVNELEEVKALRRLPSIPRLLMRLHDRKVLSDPDYFISRYGTYGLSAMVHRNSGMVAITTASPSTTYYPMCIEERPMVVDGEVVPRTVLSMSVAFDHQVMDGLDALPSGLYLKGLLEDPTELLGDL